MEQITDWNGVPVNISRSRGGVVALVNPWENLIRTSISPWPPPELVQKLYQSRQARAYTGDSFQAATSVLGFYSDLQSSRSEDAVTWSFFGPIVYAEPATRSKFVSHLLSTWAATAVHQRPLSGYGAVCHTLTAWYRADPR
jgi:hypothetical protein